jgi:hypothetical protein
MTEEAVEFGVNITAAHHMTGTWPVTIIMIYVTFIH